MGSAAVFAFVIIGLGIPLFSVLMRLNLTGSGLCTERNANLLAVYIPWTVSWLFYNGAAVEQLLSWGGMLCTSICAFLAPTLLALKATMSDSTITKTSLSKEGSIPVWLVFIYLKNGIKLLCLYLLFYLLYLLYYLLLDNIFKKGRETSFFFFAFLKFEKENCFFYCIIYTYIEN